MKIVRLELINEDGRLLNVFFDTFKDQEVLRIEDLYFVKDGIDLKIIPVEVFIKKLMT